MVADQATCRASVNTIVLERKYERFGKSNWQALRALSWRVAIRGDGGRATERTAIWPWLDKIGDGHWVLTPD